jgi:hypothetical protein
MRPPRVARLRCWLLRHDWGEWAVCAISRRGLAIHDRRCHRCGVRRITDRFEKAALMAPSAPIE